MTEGAGRERRKSPSYLLGCESVFSGRNDIFYITSNGCLNNSGLALNRIIQVYQ
jgi:hypothetical protein